jgi:hypothetical protein
VGGDGCSAFPGGEEELSYGHVSYNSRHLAQEDHLKETKTIEELEKAKSTIKQVVSVPHLIPEKTHATDAAANLVSRIGVMYVQSSK